MNCIKVKQKKYSILDTYTLAFKVAPFSVIFYTLLEIVCNAFVPFSVVITAAFIDSTQGYMSGKNGVEDVAKWLICMFIFFLVDWTWYAFRALVVTRIDNRLLLKFNTEVIRLQSMLEYKYIDDEKTYDLLKRINDNKLIDALVNLMSFMGFCVKLLGTLIILISNVWWAGIVFIVISIPTMFIANKSGKMNYDAEKKITNYRRKEEYFRDLMWNRDAALERTVFQYGDEVNNKWKDNYDVSLKKILETRFIWGIRKKLGSIAIILMSVCVMLVLIKPVANNEISVGLYVALVSVLTQLAFKMQWMLIGGIERISKSTAFLNDFTDFVNMEKNEDYYGKISNCKEKICVEFEHVYFRYPNNDKYVLEDVSFVLYPDKHYALVGSNGSGKSTIIKLLLRLYKVDKGKIRINGEDINSIEYKKLISRMSVVYQDFCKYWMSIKDNIVIGKDKEISEDVYDEIIKQADLVEVIDKFEDKSNTLLGKIDSEGVDVSEGEWQKIAIARSLMRDSYFCILDEPTSALSPKLEAMIYEKYSDLFKDRMTLLVSHRLGSTQLADEIIVLDQGKIVETGNQKDLLSKRGLYYEMFESQKQWY